MLRTFEAARIQGWHIYQHVQVRYSQSTGARDFDVDTRILCPSCIGTPRSRPNPPPPVLEGQADILEDLNINLEPAEKEKKPRKGGKAVS